MTEWGVVLVIISVVGLIAAVTGPIVKLNTSITKLTVMMGNVTGDLDELTTKNSKSHERIHEKLERHDGAINDHDKRIHVLERAIKRKASTGTSIIRRNTHGGFLRLDHPWHTGRGHRCGDADNPVFELADRQQGEGLGHAGHQLWGGAGCAIRRSIFHRRAGCLYGGTNGA